MNNYYDKNFKKYLLIKKGKLDEKSNKINYNFISWINDLGSHISVTCVTKAWDNELIFVQFSINFTGKDMKRGMIFL